MSAGEQARAAELREAFVAGAEWVSDPRENDTLRKGREREAARRYPDPAEPRVVTDSTGAQWRYLPHGDSATGDLQYQGGPGGLWMPVPAITVGGVFDAERVRIVCDLMALPFIRGGVPCASAAG